MESHYKKSRVPPILVPWQQLVLAYAVLFAEFVYASASIDDLLLAGIKRVACRAHFDTEILAKRRACCKLVATTTGDFYIVVIGMNVGFHFLALRSALVDKNGRVGYSEAAIPASPYFLSTDPVDKTVEEN